MEKANVLSLVPYQIFPAKMGGQKGIALFNEYLAKELNLICVTTKNNDPSLAKGYVMYNILSNAAFRYINIFYFFTLRKIISKNKITHIILEHPYWGWLGFLLKAFCHVQLVTHSHNIEALRFKSTKRWWWKILWHYEKWTYKQANINFFITEDDLQFALLNYDLDKNNCHLITYGSEMETIPSSFEREASKKEITTNHNIGVREKILFFNGTLDYPPNLLAVDTILKNINPVLCSLHNFPYKIIICGKNLPTTYNNLEAYKNKNIVYAGFVSDIKSYFLGSDIFINPVIEGGGIKTKLVEALAYNLSVISTKSGAIGVPANITNNKMYLGEDNDWDTFIDELLKINPSINTPDVFFKHFYWGNIAKKAAGIIRNSITTC